MLIAGKKSHGPEVHEYEKSVSLLKVLLDSSPNLKGVKTEFHLNGWPEDPRTLEDADTIMTISDGQDGDLFSPVPWMTPERMEVMQRQMQRGCGFITLHFSTFAPDELAPQILDWGGGYFDWQDETGRRNWFSRIKTLDSDVKLPTPDHPICRGLSPFKLRDEFYYRIRFQPDDKRLRPILLAPEVSEVVEEQIVAWAVEREDGGRGFCTTTGHFFDNWQNDSYRKLILNAIAWTAKAEVPAEGVASRNYAASEVDQALGQEPIEAVIVTGHQYPGHPWRLTSPALEEALRRDPRLRVTTMPDPEFLADEALRDFDLIVFNYCNWQRPGLSDEAKEGFVKYLNEGGGLILVHFANGAFHASLPEAGDSDWPEYRNICRRVWDHAEGKSGHDAYGKFQIEIAAADHPITRGQKPFETTDELYYRQQGEQPIEVLATARSKDTGHDEPLAFVYEYGKGRVFQTLLGHDAESLRVPGTAALIRRAAAWVARREQIELEEQEEIPSADAPKSSSTQPKSSEKLVAGRFGKALNAAATSATAAHHARYDKPPLSVECWARLNSQAAFNILVAKNPKECADHWQLFTFAGNGEFTVYLPGCEPDHVRSGVDVCDDQWHHLAATFDGERVQLFIDGERKADAPVKRVRDGGESGPLWIGAYPPGRIGCDGLIDDVRISSIVRDFAALPEAALKADDDTIGLWQFDELDKRGAVPDASSFKNPAGELAAAGSSAANKIDGHWGEDQVGFRWVEADSYDDRWNQMDVGPSIAASLPVPGGVIAKGLALRLGDEGQAAVAYDTKTMTLRSGWTGEFLRFGAHRLGVLEHPQPAGDVQFFTAAEAAWETATVRYGGLHLSGSRAVLEYRVDETEVLESCWFQVIEDLPVFSRVLKIAPHTGRLQLEVCDGEGIPSITIREGLQIAAVEAKGVTIAVAARGDPEKFHFARENKRRIVVRFPPVDVEWQHALSIWRGPTKDFAAFVRAIEDSKRPGDLAELARPGERRWPRDVTTRGTRSENNAAYVVDTIDLPFDNPYRALLFTSGHDFFSDGDAAVCTVHGDVWRVSGIDDALDKVTWRRFATGLYQPLGLKIVDEKVHVLGRDQITRLHDENDDGEADFYECLFNADQTSTAGHDFAAGLETDRAGNFYYVRAGVGLVKVAADGQRHKVVASGFRNPNGLSVGPGDEITVAPQEGEWTPASCIIAVRPGGYYGFGGPKVTAERPLGYDPPLCWLPRLVDNSTGGQVWSPAKGWGPLSGQLLNLSYGRCWLQTVLRETIGETTQGGVVTLPVQFESGAMRGRFHPRDGQLYVTGLKGWVTSAAKDGCLQRVRYTGQPAHTPIGLNVLKNGVRIEFSEPLDKAEAQDAGNYSIHRWNYRYRAEYGSPEYKPSNPDEQGRDEVEVLSATLLEGNRAVFVELADVRPVMQQEVRCALIAADGGRIDQSIHHTIHVVPEATIKPGPHARQPRRGQLPDELLARLRPGLIARPLAKSESRLASLRRTASVSERSSLTLSLEGFLFAPLKTRVQFAVEGNAAAQVWINEQEIPLAASRQTQLSRELTIPLHKGHNRLRLRMTPAAQREADESHARLLWRGEDFDWEPVPPTLLFHDSGDGELQAAARLHAGRDLFARHRCVACHAVPAETLKSPHRLPELGLPGPGLLLAGQRFNRDWLYHWLLDPPALRSDATMPRLLAADQPRDRQAALDVAAHLAWVKPSSGKATSQRSSSPEESETEAADVIARGEVLYEDLGCIACHNFQPPDEADEFRRVSLHFAAAKFAPGELRKYLRNPQAHFAWTAMPDFHLSDEEAHSLAAFVQTAAKGRLAPPADGLVPDAPRGEKLFTQLGCANCHSLSADKPIAKPAATPLFVGAERRGEARGCLAVAADAARRGSAPNYAFDDSARGALSAFLSGEPSLLASDSPAEASTRLIASLRCAACHDRGAATAPWPGILELEGTQGLPPERPPSLSFAGEKLQTNYLLNLLSGQVAYRARPWLKARMPAFPAWSQHLAAGLAAEHGRPSQEFTPAAAEQPASSVIALIEAGQRLTQREGGLDCRQCHAPAGEVLNLDNKAYGIGLAYVADRLRPDYYHRWMHDPLRIDPQTKMPRLAPDGRTTKVTSEFGGDAARQFEAIWAYLHTLSREPRSP